LQIAQIDKSRATLTYQKHMGNSLLFMTVLCTGVDEKRRGCD